MTKEYNGSSMDKEGLGLGENQSNCEQVVSKREKDRINCENKYKLFMYQNSNDKRDAYSHPDMVVQKTFTHLFECNPVNFALNKCYTLV